MSNRGGMIAVTILATNNYNNCNNNRHTGLLRLTYRLDAASLKARHQIALSFSVKILLLLLIIILEIRSTITNLQSHAWLQYFNQMHGFSISIRCHVSIVIILYYQGLPLLTLLLRCDTRTPLVDISNKHRCFLTPFTLYSYYKDKLVLINIVCQQTANPYSSHCCDYINL